ncbi:MAG: EboA domain-containing protein [Chitinophagaceae bacterium]
MDEGWINETKALMYTVLKRQLVEDAFKWLEEKALLINPEQTANHLFAAFAIAPRKTGREMIKLTEAEVINIRLAGKGFSISGWTIDRLTRAWLLMQVDDQDREAYCKKIESLFRDAEMNELVALYSSLPFFSYPETWQLRTAEGIRSNIGNVLEAIMYENPYPFNYLSEQAWNQMVLKAFFTDKQVDRILGLDERANKPLSDILVDYAKERWAAHRSVHPQLWRLVSPFIDNDNFLNIKKLFNNGNHIEKQAAALACYHSRYEPARQLLAGEPSLYNAISKNLLNWHTINTLVQESKN